MISAPPPERRRQRVLLALLLAAVTINYIDRGSLSVAIPSMSREFSLSDSQRGWLLSGFFWTYSICQIGAGWLVDRFGVKWVYAAGFLLWSLATATTGLLSSFEALLACRLLLGIGESVTYPGNGWLLARNFSEEQRGFANGLVDAGSKLGPALSILLGGLAVEWIGWRALFLTVGFGSLIWLWPWTRVVPSGKADSDQDQLEPPRMGTILSRGEAWGTSLGMFALGYAWTFLISWLPTYLVEHRGLSNKEMALAGSLPFWGMAIMSIAGGWFSDRWIARGGQPNKVRKTFLIAGLLLCSGLLIPVDLVRGSTACLVLLIAASVSLGIFTSNVWAVTQTLAGPAAAGKWVGIQNCVGNLGGVVAPALTGIVVQRTGSYFPAFVLSSVVLLLGIGAYVFLVPRIAPLNWTRKPLADPPAVAPR